MNRTYLPSPSDSPTSDASSLGMPPPPDPTLVGNITPPGDDPPTWDGPPTLPPALRLTPPESDPSVPDDDLTPEIFKALVMDLLKSLTSPKELLVNARDILEHVDALHRLNIPTNEPHIIKNYLLFTQYWSCLWKMYDRIMSVDTPTQQAMCLAAQGHEDAIHMMEQMPLTQTLDDIINGHGGFIALLPFVAQASMAPNNVADFGDGWTKIHPVSMRFSRVIGFMTQDWARTIGSVVAEKAATRRVCAVGNEILRSLFSPHAEVSREVRDLLHSITWFDGDVEVLQKLEQSGIPLCQCCPRPEHDQPCRPRSQALRRSPEAEGQSATVNGTHDDTRAGTYSTDFRPDSSPTPAPSSSKYERTTSRNKRRQDKRGGSRAKSPVSPLEHPDERQSLTMSPLSLDSQVLDTNGHTKDARSTLSLKSSRSKVAIPLDFGPRNEGSQVKKQGRSSSVPGSSTAPGSQIKDKEDPITPVSRRTRSASK